ncbi:MAG: phospholipase [Planctomycetes bacterium]|nr:phospholipase [Planctomycetota bacterium]
MTQSINSPLSAFPFPLCKIPQSATLIFLLTIAQVLTARGAEMTDRFEATVTKQVSSHYLVVKPDGYDESKTYPLLIFLHGRGEQGDDLAKVTIHGPYEMVKKLGLEVIIVAPQSPLDERWDIDMLSAFVDAVLEKYPIDRQRVYLTGLSMGGEGAWRLAIHRPNTFAALVPICGVGPSSQAAKISHLPTWAFHGAKDSVVRVAGTKKMIAAMQTAGGKPRVTIYDNVGHNSWKPAYDDPELYEWLLDQSLTNTTQK